MEYSGMAEKTVSDRRVDSVGAMRREIATFEHQTSADYEIKTKLGHVKSFRILSVGANGTSQAVEVILNGTQAAGRDTTGGIVGIDKDTLTDANKFVYEAMGY
jgi:hypothetical protein